ncbi:26S proteasome regulatory subunit N6 [Cryptococcus wingfieldii CBS 7118]|uniref:Probable 26S proteasome regulatory subunit rpn-6.2 n=1 Tax=Cryptococcus wingfieldii CBS 7118 TaxID=1295528 RepID=A0A1E3IF08_9TREE|nr:26S proteasome regulatory subunit N6 [Cryptococcus wingfieldii CBS 7118]ODN87098.1 26S proteasome regulatory subunit N6 [Cryptococcus wingfieldii CBS 7118]
MALESSLTLLEQADDVASTSPQRAEELYRELLNNNQVDESSLRDKESALLKLGSLFKDQNRVNDLAELVTASRSFMSQVAKAKTAKIIRGLLDMFPVESRELQMKVTQDNIEWATKEKRVFLRQSLDIKLISLQLDAGQYRPALTAIEGLLKELKQLDDKIILTEVYLLESRAAHAIQNHTRAKTALTSARTTANSIYCPPILQAQLDLQSGVIMADDKDYKTGYSYFFEAFEGHTQVAEKDERALKALKYMLLCKVMMGLPDDVFSSLLLKSAQPYAGRDLDAMKAAAVALKDRSLESFKTALKDYTQELQKDPLIRSHLSFLYDTLLEQNLVRIIEPYSNVEISWVAEEVGQSSQVVEEKLSQMILDGIFHGVLNESLGTLEVHDQAAEEPIYTSVSDTLKNVNEVVKSLYDKAAQVV